MEKEKLRSEIEEKYKWDLTRIYKNPKEWDKDLEELDKLIDKIPSFKGKLFSDSKTLKEYFEIEVEIDKLINKLYSYASLEHDVDISNTESQKRQDLILSSIYKFSEKDSFFQEELFKKENEEVKKLLDEDDFLKDYELLIERQNRYRDHYLTSEKEELVSIMSKALEANDNTYKILTNSELKFDSIKDEDNNIVELTDTNYATYIRSKDRRVREEAFKSLYKGYEGLKNTITSTYMGSVDGNIAISKIYKFPGVLENKLYNDNIPVKVYDNLVEEVSKGLDNLYEYYKFKKDILGVEELHLYDTYVDLIQEKTKKYTYEEAKDIVLDVIKLFGDDYVEKATKIFDNKLIDVMPNKNKRGGAYSSGTYDTDPFILTNFNGSLTDVSTIIHELGHSMHTTYSNENNIRQYADYRIFVAEVASTVNEILLALTMLENSDDEKEKLSIINKLLDDYKATIYRQTMFAEFERYVYSQREKGVALTSDELCDYYLELNKKYFGKDVVVDDEIKYEWERIPHFYTPFYVYKYATSMSASIVIANKIFSGDKEFTKKYINFLSLGGSMWPIDELKTLGIDMEDGKVIKEAMDSFGKLLDEFIEKYKLVYND